MIRKLKNWTTQSFFLGLSILLHPDSFTALYNNILEIDISLETECIENSRHDIQKIQAEFKLAIKVLIAEEMIYCTKPEQIEH